VGKKQQWIARQIATARQRLWGESPPLSDAALAAIAEARGFDLVRRHYYSPVPQREDLARPGFWDEESPLHGLDMRDTHAIAFLQDVLPPYLAEFRDLFPVENAAGETRFCVVNGVYMAVDAHVYYGMLRHLRPRRLIEVGSGQSTRVAVQAVERNGEEGKGRTEILAIEPYPSEVLRGLATNRRLSLLEMRVQDVPFAEFEALEAGDVLFIDSTHVLREGGDVQFEYLEILPRLKPGVHVHIHDISLPRRYPRVYCDQGTYWNEQYLLQAFLCFNEGFEVTWPGNYMLLRHPDLMTEMFPEIAAMRRRFPLAEPSAFWMRRRGTSCPA
jgi:hypothetical protein